MKQILVASLLVGLAVGGIGCSVGDIEVPENLGDSSSRIVGGSTFDGLPAVGALTYNGSAHCTGTLIAPRKVVTAGHCVYGFSASKMRFVIGSSLSSAQYTLAVASIQAHPQYNDAAITNDIGLVTLSQDAPVAPMAVVQNMDSSWVGTNLFFVGYGVNNGYNQTGAGTKRAVWMALSQVNSTSFRYDDPNKNTCNGDSGGPAFYQDSAGNYLVAGVTSYGDAYCTQYGVDTRVDAYLDFLGIDGSDDGGGSQPADPCNGETWEGRCDGDTVVWCENSQIYRQDCAKDGKACGFSATNGYYACVAAVDPDPDPEPEPDPEPQDPCAGETYEGRCQGDSVVWCENDQIQTQDCAAEGLECVFDQTKGYFACREPAPVDPCNGETFAGRCEAGTVIWCENEQVNSINCSAGGKSCAYNSAKGYYDCL